VSTLAEWAAGAARTRPTLDPPGRARPVGLPGAEVAVLTVGAFALYLAVAAYIALHLGVLFGDALSRVANAADVIFSRDPHLAAIGFIWNPLPSLLEMPLVALRGWVPAMVKVGFAGNVVSAAFGAVGVAYLDRTLWRFGLSRRHRLALCAVLALNPLIVLYAANGMTDVMLAAALLAALDGALGYVQGGSLRDLTAGAVWLAVAFAIRYEAVPFTVCVALGALVGLLRKGEAPSRIEGALVLYVAPVAYAAGIWIYFNWLIMKNPFYFLDSVYSNTSQTATGAYAAAGSAIQLAYHHPLAALAYVAHFTLLYFPVIPALLALALGIVLRPRDARVPVVLGAIVSVPALQALLLDKGASAGWDRFFIDYIPMGLVALALGAVLLPARMRAAALVAAVLVGAAGDAGTMAALLTPTLGHGDQPYVRQILAGRKVNAWAQDEAVAAYVDRHPRLLVITDTFTSYAVVLFAARPRQFIITSDRDFQSILLNPRGRASAILVPQPVGLDALDAVNTAYPELWAGKVPWARLIRAFPGAEQFRLYAVGPSAP
jgi:hypothetical protein